MVNPVKFGRLKRQLTQDELAVRIHISQPYISLMELGRYIPTHAEADRIRRELDLPAHMTPVDLVLKSVEMSVAQ
jgi:transcriptional regulator with XRE-family HTH domain